MSSLLFPPQSVDNNNISYHPMLFYFFNRNYTSVSIISDSHQFFVNSCYRFEHILWLAWLKLGHWPSLSQVNLKNMIWYGYHNASETIN